MSVVDRERVGAVMTGEEFNKTYPEAKLVKLTNDTEIHHGFQFNDGLNIDTKKFQPNGHCSPGGIYFIEECYIHNWIHYDTINETKTMVNIRKVTIPDDAIVYIEYDKLKADKIILGPKSEISRDIYIKAVNKISSWLRHVPLHLRDEEICTEAVRQCRASLQYVPDKLYEKVWMNSI